LGDAMCEDHVGAAAESRQYRRFGLGARVTFNFSPDRLLWRP
jgi:hypothetical protein